MVGYARGELEADEDRLSLCKLHSFWNSVQPAERSLPAPYYRLLADYRIALANDAGLAVPREAGTRVNEIACFYLLLGSSHGARYMLRHAPSATRRSHLEILVAKARPLWTHFVDDVLENLPPDQHAQVLSDSNRLFNLLYETIGMEDAV